MNYPALLSLATLLLTPVAPITAASSSNRPNVLIVLTDDQGMGDFSCYGNPVLKTPHLDRLREQSVRFTDFHVAPMCTPTRGQLLTGQDAVRNGATSVTGGRSFIRPGIPTGPEMFTAAGYRTGIFGKWHLGDSFPHRPMDRGFEEAVYFLGWGFTSAPEYGNRLFDGRCFHNGAATNFTGYCTDYWFARAMVWMKEKQAAREPFFCYLALNAPHTPCVVAGEYSAPYEGKGPANFFGMIANIDENIGRLEEFLRRTGLRDNTILIFLTDNGGTLGVKTWNAGLRAGKTTFYDGGHRVPCWLRWPAGGLSDPRDLTCPTQVQDLLPTLLDLCGVKRPKTAHFDGVSLAGVLRGTELKLADRMFVVQYSRARLEQWECAVVWGQWRLVHGKELYNVSTDRAQKDDLSTNHPEVVAKMREHYEKWWNALEPLTGQFVPLSIGASAQPMVLLTSSDWQDVYADNAGHVRQAAGGPRGGHWNVNVQRAGDYEITLRRWPAEEDVALSANNGPESRALPIAGAKLNVAGQALFSKADISDKAIVFRTRLPPGLTKLHGWFVDERDNDLCGAFYASVRRLP